MTNAAMYSPKGRTWQGKGNTPDFLVEQDEKRPFSPANQTCSQNIQ